MTLRALLLYVLKQNDDDEQRVFDSTCLSKYAFFSEWTLQDISHAKAQLQARACTIDDLCAPSTAPHDSLTLAETATKWEDFYTITFEVQNRREESLATAYMRGWHPACAGYTMRIHEAAVAEFADCQLGDILRPKDESMRPDYHTDDEASEDEAEAGAGEGQDSGQKIGPRRLTKAQKVDVGAKAGEAEPLVRADVGQIRISRPIPEMLDVNKRSPIFFGYQTATLANQEEEERDANKQAETARAEALARLREKRVDKITQVIEDARAKRLIRERKIDGLTEIHRKKAEERQRERRRLQQILPTAEYQTWVPKWAEDDEMIAVANALESDKQKAANQAKTEKDEQEVEELQRQLQAYDDLLSLARPQGPLLVESARAELVHSSEALSERMRTLKEVQRDMTVLTDDFDRDPELTRSTAAETRALRVSIEARLNEERRKLEAALLALNDTEILLQQAVARKDKEDLILPLYSALRENINGQPFLSLMNLLTAIHLLSQVIPFQGKVKHLLDLFADSAAPIVTLRALTTLLRTALIVYHQLGYLLFSVPNVDVGNIVRRAFLDAHIDPSLGMTPYEAQQWLTQLVSHSPNLSSLLDCPSRLAEYSSYQCQNMPITEQYCQGLLSMTDVKYHINRQLLTPRPLLSSEAKMLMHTRALNQGTDDPLKPIYRLMSRPSKGGASVIALTHGHLGSLLEWRRQVGKKAATYLQAIYRGIKGRERAELRAKVLAFCRAEETALRRMEEQVQNNVLSEEDLKGQDKLKHDARIRARAAKMRAAGLPSKREDVLALLIKEGMEEGTRDVTARFAEMAQERGWESEVKDVKADLARKQDSINRANEEKMKKSGGEVGTYRANIGNAALPDSGVDVKNMEDELVLPIGEDEKSWTPEAMELRGQALVRGIESVEPLASGMTLLEQILSLRMSLPEMGRESWIGRLCALSAVMTPMKVEEMILELPSKRLMMRYIDRMRQDDLAGDLATHYRLVRGAKVVADVLRDLHITDLECGTMARGAQKMVQNQYGLLLRGCTEDYERRGQETESMVNRASRTGAMIALNTESQVVSLVQNKKSLISKMRDVAANLERGLMKSDKRLEDIYAGLEKVGEKTEELERYLSVEVRRQEWEQHLPRSRLLNWWERYAAAVREPDIDAEASRDKYTELSSLGHEFLATAERLASVIVDEMYVPAGRKTIKPTAVTGMGMQGAPSAWGEGHEEYEAGGMRLRVLIDGDGLCNGSDEFAAKRGGAERRNSMEVQKMYLEGLGVPLVATIDVHGFRVLVVSKMPTEIIRYDTSGELRSRKEIFCFGTKDDGKTFVSSDKKLEARLEEVSQRLNLARHNIKAFQDVYSRSIWASADLHAYKAENGIYHLLNFWRLLPCEDPGGAEHLIDSPRDASMFYRFLRPEHVKQNATPLSADANLILTNGCEDMMEQIAGIQNSTATLVHGRLRTFAESLAALGPQTGSAAEGYGVALTYQMQHRGINMRHLGRLRSLFWRRLSAKVNLVYQSRRLTCQADLTGEIERGDHVRVLDHVAAISVHALDEFSAKAITLTEAVPFNSLNCIDIWAGEVSNDRNSEQMRLLILAEMVARTMKNVLRGYLRMLLKTLRTATIYVQTATLVEFLNILTGSHAEASEYWTAQIYPNLISRFGYFSVSHIERFNLQHTLAPAILYILNRLQDMLGFQLTPSCSLAMNHDPLFFHFTIQDLDGPPLRSKHNIAMLPFADAMLANLKADVISSVSYSDYILKDEPLLYWKLTDRQGAKLVHNYGSLGSRCNGDYSAAVIFEATGPIRNEGANRAIRLEAGEKARVDALCAEPRLAPMSCVQHFSVEVWARVTGGWDTHRVLISSRRYCLTITRENRWAVQVFVKYVQVVLLGPEVCREAWQHVVLAYDGCMLRLYVNACYTAGLEVPLQTAQKLQELREQRLKAKEKIDGEERAAQIACREKAEQHCDRYYRSQKGRTMVETQAANLFEQADKQTRIRIQREGGSLLKTTIVESTWGESTNTSSSGGENETQPLSMEQAVKQVKEAYVEEMFSKDLRKVTQKFKAMRGELQTDWEKADTQAELASSTVLRMGSMGPSASSSEGTAFFQGEACHLAIYECQLTQSQVQGHYLSGIRDRSLDAERLYTVAAEGFQKAMRFAPNDHLALSRYAECVCNYVGTNAGNKIDAARLRMKVDQALELFRGLENLNAMAGLLRRLPDQVVFADVACKIFETIIAAQPHYFSGTFFGRKELALVSERFLLYESTKPGEVQTSAEMYRVIMQDQSLSDFYGECDLSFLPLIQNASVILGLVKHARMGQDARMLDINAYRDCADLSDEDLVNILEYRRGATSVNVQSCRNLTDTSLKRVARCCPHLILLNLDNCVLVTDDSLRDLAHYCKELASLSCRGCVNITTPGLELLMQQCSALRSINLGQCFQMTDYVLQSLARHLPKLEQLQINHCPHLTDIGFLRFVHGCKPTTNLTVLDVSVCSRLSDDSFELIGHVLINLTDLNLSSARATDIGMRPILQHLWKLQTLRMEDVCLVSDAAFHIHEEADGRREVEEKMLTEVTELDIRDCSRLGDEALASIANRCTGLMRLNMSGCSSFSEAGLAHFVEVLEDREDDEIPSRLVHLQVAYCPQLSIEVLQTFIHCHRLLEKLDLSGCTCLTDSRLHIIAQHCPHLQCLAVARCRGLTDLALCGLADYLWIEELDLSYCSRITNEGIEIVALEFKGLRILKMAGLSRVTKRALRILKEECAATLSEMDILGCQGICREAIDEMQVALPRLKVSFGQQSGDDRTHVRE